MKELLVDSISSVDYTIYVDGVATAATGEVTAKITRELETATVTAAAGVPGTYSFIVPPSMISTEGSLTVEWSFTVQGYPMKVTEVYDITTPYSPWHYFKDVTTYKEYLECERVARKIIDSYCGQSFGKEHTTYGVEGTGNNGLRLPRRLMIPESVKWLNIDTVPNIITVPSQDYTYYAWELAADGWILRNATSRIRIDAAYTQRDTFGRNTIYNVTGLWGWDQVPTNVTEASKILTANYLCQDQKYRDKYLASIATGDWDIKFAPQAFNGTGSATADELLKDYRMFPGIGVI